MFKLICAVKNYEWGKIGKDSEVYKLVDSSGSDATLDPELPFAELWMGTHPSGPAYLSGTDNTSLAEYVSKHVASIGIPSKEKFGRTLPFLLKVLSVNKALSIQAHPTKEHAKKLNQQRPDLYKDDNHKPEMAIALTPFEALVGFRRPAEIAAFVYGIQELFEVVGKDCLSDLTAASTGSEDMAGPAIKEAYRMLMCTAEAKIELLVEQLRLRLHNGDRPIVAIPPGSQIDMEKIIDLYIRLATEYPGDVGCFSLFFLNYICLQPGEAIFLEANLPHAYLYGDCVECMACSDNVVRAGLTPKFKDVDCLLSMLLYEPRTASDLKFDGVKQLIEFMADTPPVTEQTDSSSGSSLQEPEVISFRPPVEDFAVDKITIPPNCHAFELVAIPTASILLVIRGSGYLQRIYATTPESTNHKQGDSETTNTTQEEPVEDKSETKEKVSTKQLLPAARVHETMDFTCGSVFFLGAGTGCFIHPYMVKTNDDQDTPVEPCLVFRAYVNVDT